MFRIQHSGLFGGLTLSCCFSFLVYEAVNDIFLDPRGSTECKTDTEWDSKPGKVNKCKCFGSDLCKIILVVEIRPMTVYRVRLQTMEEITVVSRIVSIILSNNIGYMVRSHFKSLVRNYLPSKFSVSENANRDRKCPESHFPNCI